MIDDHLATSDADPTRKLYDGYFLSSRGMSEEARSHDPQQTLQMIEYISDRGATLRDIGLALVRYLTINLNLTIEGFQGENRFWPGIRQMIDEDQENVWRLEFAERLRAEMTACAGNAEANAYAIAFVRETTTGTNWIMDLGRAGCEARYTALMNELRWMIQTPPEAASMKHLAEAFALKARIRADAADQGGDPRVRAKLDVLGFEFPIALAPVTVTNLRLLSERHGANALRHLGWVLAVAMDADATDGRARIDDTEIGTLDIEDMRIPVRGGSWADAFGRKVEIDDADARAAVGRAMGIMAGVIDIDENLRFGMHAPSAAQLSKMARMVRAGIAVPDVQQRISMTGAWEYINANNQDYLERVKEVGVFWNITQAAQTLGVGRIKLSRWLRAHGYADAYGRPSGPGKDVSLVIDGAYGEQVRWNSKFVESLRPSISEIDPPATPKPSAAKRAAATAAVAAPSARIHPGERGKFARQPMSTAQRVTLEISRSRYDAANPLANARAKRDYLARRPLETGRQFDSCVANGWLDANLQITSLGRWRLGLQLKEIPKTAPLPLDAVYPPGRSGPVLEIPEGSSPYAVEESAGRPPGPRLTKTSLSPSQERALLASWLYADPSRALDGDPPRTWDGTVGALTGRGWMNEDGTITALGRWMLALSMKKIPRTTPPPVPTDHLGAGLSSRYASVSESIRGIFRNHRTT